MTHPTTPLESLSEDAQMLYSRTVDDDHSTLVLDRDWLAPNAHRMSKHAFRSEWQLDPDFQPDQRLLAAVGELTGAGYARHSHGSTLSLTRVDPKLYTVARGRHPWDIRVSRVPRPGMRGADGSLIAVLENAELSTREDSMGRELRLKVRVPGAYDIEHDPAYAASITLQLPTFPQIYGSCMTFWGVASEAHLYPLGTDPTLLDDRTHKPIDDPVRCESEYCTDDPHVFAPYLPPAVDLGRATLCVEARIRRDDEEG